MLQDKCISRAHITALGAFVPPKHRTNRDIETRFSKPNGWIYERTGVKDRRRAATEEFASDLAVAACQNLVLRYGADLTDVDLILGATTSPDCMIPSMACLVQDKLGLAHAGAFDVQAACSSFVYGLQLADALITAGHHKKVLVVAGETMSKIISPIDLQTQAIFGDGGGAALVEYAERGSLIASTSGTCGLGADLVYRTDPTDTSSPVGSDPYLRMNGAEVYRWVTQSLPNLVTELVDKADLSLSEVDWFVPHSANLRMIERVCDKLKFPLERTLLSLECFGNTSAASIPLALSLGIDSGRIAPGHKILLYGFGAGLSHAGMLFEWDASGWSTIEPTLESTTPGSNREENQK